MADPTWRVVVLRAWLEGARLRVRVLTGDDLRRSQVVDGVDEALAVVADLLRELETLPDTSD